MSGYALNRRFWTAVFFKAGAALYVEASRTYLSIAWWILEPVLFMGIYYVVFGLLLQFREPDFVAFLLVGLASWQWFEKSVLAAAGSILEGGLIVDKVPINKLFFPLSVVFADVLKTLLVFSVLLLFLAFRGFVPDLSLLGFVYVVIVQLTLVVTASSWCALVTPFFPDFRLLLNAILRATMFASGIFYSANLVPEAFKPYFFWNPMALLIDEFRNALIRGLPLRWAALTTIFAVSLLLMIGAVGFSTRFGDRYLKRVL